jgi:hypothetical protein
MLGDGLKALGHDEDVRVLDVAELVAAALPAPAQANCRPREGGGPESFAA